VRHALQVVLAPAEHRIEVEDTVSLPAAAGRSVEFVLHAGLDPHARGAVLEALSDGAATPDSAPVRRYRATLNGGGRQFTLDYGGKIDHPLEQVPEEARQFEVTPGLIDDEGVFLDSTSAWFPLIGDAMMTFTLDVRLPGGWDAVSQGERHLHKRERDHTTVRWDCDKPQDDIYLVAARFTQYHDAAAGVRLMAFLRTPDPALAQRYLRAAGHYIEQYQKLLGPYPYGKFALVENFWQSGYGMPSFTLLGSQIIRFPFIIYTSFPHEILHDWWGNGVYVDYAQGNWSEGLTAYLSDHLVQEQRHKGAEYRRELLQKYTDFVSGDQDFPLSEFTARHSETTEAVGYGKALMFFHMLRRQLGDAAFVAGLRRFYKDNVFKTAGYSDLRRALEAETGRDLGLTFDQWVTRTGAPRLAASGAAARQEDGGWRLTFTLEQNQAGPDYRMDIPVAVTLEGHAQAYQTTVSMTARRSVVSIYVPARPLRVDVDPEFDVFRRLSRDEIPPALSGLFGAPSLLIVLPAAAPAPLLRAYRALADGWRDSPAFHVEVTTDRELSSLPRDRAVWLFGGENRFKPQLQQALVAYQEVGVDEHGSLRVDDQPVDAAGRSAVFVAANPGGDHPPLGWLMTTRSDTLPGLARKLPHYSKYSYLVFDGDAPTNVDRGVWPVLHSPLTLAVGGATVPMAALTPRRPLIQLIDDR
jgi:aminopeptidase N